jgi:hypothetical protein
VLVGMEILKRDFQLALPAIYYLFVFNGL